MPELPEVETVRTGLESALKGARIRRVTLRRKGLRVPFPTGFSKALAGCTITSVGRRAKYLLFYTDGPPVMLAHLGMSGRFLVHNEHPVSYGKHDHVVIELGDGRVVIFSDPRRFGLITLVTRKNLPKHPLLAHLGPEPLGEEFTADYLRAALKKRPKSPIKTALMDQALVVGVGNIYASEVLFDAGIDPRRPAASVAQETHELAKSIRKILHAAIVSGGSSLRDFVTISGDSGYFQHHFRVYGRAGEPCESCGASIQMIRQAGRSSFFCPNCQR